MPVYIHKISTAVPSHTADQQAIRELMKSKLGEDRKTRAILHRIYSQSGIDKRHTVISDFFSDDPEAFFNRALSHENAPSTEERNEYYKKTSVPLFLEAGQALLDETPDLDPADITHVITVSCTGFFAPGPDYEVVKGLGLKDSTQRFHVGFMGCYAVFPALRMAKAFCEADPGATVLIISAELCTLHFQFQDDTDNMIASSVFADGATGVIVSSRKPADQGFELQGFSSSLASEGEKDMAWTIGDKGFKMVLSSYVPEIISAKLGEVMKPLFDSLSIQKEEINRWAVHPGGRAILDKVEEAMQLQPCHISSSRQVLADYGNMSSATILFVLRDLMESGLTHGDKIVPIAFGPGLTIESGLFTYSEGQEE